MSLYVAIPCMDTIPTEFASSLLTLHVPPKSAYGFTVATLVYDARNTLAKAVLETKEFDRVLWLDSDMKFTNDLAERLSADIDEGRDFVSGLYVARKEPIKPIIFSSCGYRENDKGEPETYADFYMDYPRDEVFEVGAVGFGCLMVTRDLLEKVYQNYGAPFAPLPGFGEDLSFCHRCKELGIKMYCDSRIKCGHIGTKVYTENDLN